MVLVALLITVLVGMAGFAIDFSRMYVMKAQLQTTADASALAAIIEVRDKRPTNAVPVAQQYPPLNRVETQEAFLPSDSIQPGTWNFGTRSFQPLSSWTDPGVTAVRVTARYTGEYTFGRVFGASTSGLRAVAVAAVGYVGASDCIRPWAVSYQALLDGLFGTGVKDPSYNLTSEDIQRLAQMSAAGAVPLALLKSTSSQITSGNIAEVVVNNPWSGNSPNDGYQGAIAGCANMVIGPGTWLNANPGAGSGQTENALKDFCKKNGGVTVKGQDFTCIGQPKVKMAVWDIYNGSPGNNLKFRVKYIGVFAIVSYTKGVGKAKSDEQITGYFSSMASDGAFSSTPSPVTGPVAIVE
jgi:hypothetical protein